MTIFPVLWIVLKKGWCPLISMSYGMTFQQAQSIKLSRFAFPPDLHSTPPNVRWPTYGNPNLWPTSLRPFPNWLYHMQFYWIAITRSRQWIEKNWPLNNLLFMCPHNKNNFRYAQCSKGLRPVPEFEVADGGEFKLMRFPPYHHTHYVIQMQGIHESIRQAHFLPGYLWTSTSESSRKDGITLAGSG